MIQLASWSLFKLFLASEQIRYQRHRHERATTFVQNDRPKYKHPPMEYFRNVSWTYFLRFKAFVTHIRVTLAINGVIVGILIKQIIAFLVLYSLSKHIPRDNEI